MFCCRSSKYAGRLDPVDVSFGGLAIKWDDLGQMNVGVALDEGGKVIEPVVQVSDMQRSQPSILTFGRKSETGRFMAERNFQPYWRTAVEFRE